MIEKYEECPWCGEPASGKWRYDFQECDKCGNSRLNPLHSYWVTFDDGYKACCRAHSENDAKEKAEKIEKKPVKDVKILPYPARPFIDDGKIQPIPFFCYDPDNCAGRGSCPKSPSCVE